MSSKREWKNEVTSLSEDDLFGRWQKDLDRLSKDVHRVHWNRDVFEALDDEIVAHQRDGTDFFLERFLRPMYVETQTVLIRRLGDDDPRSLSFRVLLEEMLLRSELLTRRRYVAQWAARYDADPEYAGLGDGEFSEHYGHEAQQVPLSVLERYRETLVLDLGRVKTFVDKFVAHEDRRTEQPITWTELNQAIENLETHLNAVGLIVTGHSHRAKLTVGSSWRKVFQKGLFLPPA